MKFSSVLLLIVSCAVVMMAGCSKQQPAKPRAEITSLQRKEAALMITEAQLALSLRDIPRAEGLYLKATALCPDTGGYWMNLGSLQVQLNKKKEAKNAYESALAAYQDALKAAPANASAALQQVVVLALLGRVDEARETLGKVAKDFPTDADIKTFVAEKQFDLMLADSEFKAQAL
jgi:tetratricopeptide (TPR) repeat protein